MTKRPTADDWDDDYSIFWGFGTVHDLHDEHGPPPRLHGLRSVSEAAVWALHNEPKTKPRQIGFKIPKAKRPR